MGARLSLRQLWVIYKRTALASGARPRELAISQAAFRNGALGVLKVLSYMAEHGDYEELYDTIHRQGRRIRRGAPATEAAPLADELRLSPTASPAVSVRGRPRARALRALPVPSIEPAVTGRRVQCSPPAHYGPQRRNASDPVDPEARGPPDQWHED